MLDLVRAASLTKFDQVVKEFGGNPAELLERIGLPKNLLKNPEMYFQYSDFVSLMNLTAYTLKQDAFGLHLGSEQGIEIFGSMSYVLKNCQTVGDALSNLRRFFHVHHTSADVGLSIANGKVTLSFAINLDLKESTAQAVDLALALGVNILKTLTSSKVRFSGVHVQHAEPVNKRKYSRYIGMMPVFNSTFNGVIFDASILDLVIDEADPELFAILTSQLNSNNVGYVDEIPTFVESIVRQNIALTPISVGDVAEMMALSVRNLQRYLKEQNTSFRQIVDNVRSKLSSQYLIDSTLSLNHISEVLGFANYSEFSRSFKRWHQMSPKDYRNLHSPRKRFTRLKNM